MLGFIPVLKETFPPIVQARHENHQQRRLFMSPARSSQSSSIFVTACKRPLVFLFRTRLIPLFTLYTSVVNSYLAILFATLGSTFETVYHFSSGASGLAYLGMLLGFLAAQLSIGILSDALIKRRANSTPEDRLTPLTIGATILPGALLLYGWSIEKELHWVVPIAGSALAAFATMYSYIPVSIYVVEVYTLHTASATGVMTIIRSAISAVVPLAAEPLYARLGYGWGYTLLAGLAAPFIWIAVVLIRWGEQIRERDKAVL